MVFPYICLLVDGALIKGYVNNYDSLKFSVVWVRIDCNTKK